MTSSNMFEHGGNLYAAVRQSGGQTEAYLDFSANINPLGLPESARLAVLEALPQVIHYPDAEAFALKEAISRRFNVDRRLITVGNGAVELLYVLCQMLRPKRVLVTAPTFSEYERAARAAGATVEYLELHPDDGFAINAEEVGRSIPRADIIFLCNPNNPTGRMLPRDEAEKLIRCAQQQNALLVVDESFIEFLPDGDDYSCRPLLKRYANLVILHSLTKFYALPGLRLGFLLADTAIGQLLDKGKDPWNVNSLAQAAGTAALQDNAYRAAALETVCAAREAFFAALKELPGIRPFPAAANFLLVDVGGTGYNSGELRRTLFAQGVLIRDCANYPGLSGNYVRLAVKLPQQNERLIALLRKLRKK